MPSTIEISLSRIQFDALRVAASLARRTCNVATGDAIRLASRCVRDLSHGRFVLRNDTMQSQKDIDFAEGIVVSHIRDDKDVTLSDTSFSIDGNAADNLEDLVTSRFGPSPSGVIARALLVYVDVVRTLLSDGGLWKFGHVENGNEFVAATLPEVDVSALPHSSAARQLGEQVKFDIIGGRRTFDEHACLLYLQCCEIPSSEKMSLIKRIVNDLRGADQINGLSKRLLHLAQISCLTSTETRELRVYIDGPATVFHSEGGQ